LLYVFAVSAMILMMGLRICPPLFEILYTRYSFTLSLSMPITNSLTPKLSLSYSLLHRHPRRLPTIINRRLETLKPPTPFPSG
jgi:hypothetical protein